MHSIDTTNFRTCRYVRKSQEDKGRQVQSIESQIDVLMEMEKREGIEVIKTYKDHASAYKPNNRDSFNELLQDINDGKIDGVLCWKADRLARNHIEGGMILHCLEKGILKFIKTPYKTYLPTDNMLPLSIEIGMSNQYSRDLSNNVRRGNRTKIKNGGFCHVAPQGYLNNKVTKTIEIDNERFYLVRKMWDLALTGTYSLKQICTIANDDWRFKTRPKERTGNVPLSVRTLHGILTNPFYYGKVKNGENENIGNHTAMVTHREFMEVQRFLSNKGRKSKTSCSFTYTGLFYCGECACSITAETKVKYKCPKCRRRHTAKHAKVCLCGYNITSATIDKGTFYTYYHCSKSKKKCAQKSITVEVLEKEVIKFLAKLEINEEFIKWSKNWLDFLKNVSKKEKEEAVFLIEQKEKRLKIQKDRLLDLRLNNEIDKETFRIKNEELEKELEAIEVSQRNDGVITRIRQELTFLEGLQKRFIDYLPKERKILLNKISSNHAIMDKEVSMQAKKVYLSLVSMRKHKKLGFEPPKSQSVKGLKGGQKECYYAWLAILNEYRTTL
ncbi:recombinase family protein [Tenacibaculum sp. TC6]|uniref:recombinase family protein n=1 Tax=Tenacibaculum sp. TC6 TaxID=3423223 RepID=UPI003D35BCDF